MTSQAWHTALVVALALAAAVLGAPPALAASAAEIDGEVDAALKKAYQVVPEARDLAAKSRAVLVFPRIYKAGFMFGAQYGEGALRENGVTVGYYSSVAASYGFQAGVQVFGYAMFFMNEHALSYLKKSDGFEIGVGPSIVIVDAGMGKSMTSTTLTQDVYAFIFDQQGLMAGAGIQGSKITKINRD